MLGAGLHFFSFGPDPLRDKGMEGVDEFQTDRVARAAKGLRCEAPARDGALPDDFAQWEAHALQRADGGVARAISTHAGSSALAAQFSVALEQSEPSIGTSTFTMRPPSPLISLSAVIAKKRALCTPAHST